jgi:TolA-binding protein
MVDSDRPPVHVAHTTEQPTPTPEMPLRPPAPASRATIQAASGARVDHRSHLPDEVVALRDGKIALEVAPLRPGERFRVVTDDAEVEVRGTAFDVVSSQGQLVSVHVTHGRVEVRPATGPLVVLTAGQQWSRPENADTAAAPKPSAPVIARSVPPAKTAVPTSREATHVAPSGASSTPRAPSPAPVGATSPTELAFRRAWDELRANHPDAAALDFARVPAGAPLGEDAMFWRGAALARAHRPAEAAQVLQAFLASFPSSTRRGEATALLGWQALALGDLAGAETKFRSIDGELPGELKKSVEAGLAEIRRRRD